MIVDPDFFDHWKTLLLVENLDGDQAAPIYVLRLWAHCQNRRQCSFDNLSDRALKALCRFPGQANKLVSALSESGFVRRSEDGQTEVVGWDEYNAKLLANWENGAKGGRPKKARNNPTETQRKPNDNPPVTHAEPIRVDRSRVDKINNSKTNSRELSTHWKSEEFQTAWFAWLSHVAAAKAPVTDSAEEAMLYQLRRFETAEAIEVVRFSTLKQAKNLIMNGDHKDKPASDGRTASGGGRRKVPSFEEGLL